MAVRLLYLDTLSVHIVDDRPIRAGQELPIETVQEDFKVEFD